MVITEYHSTREDGVKLNRTYSDKGVKIQKIVVTWKGKRVAKDEFYDAAIDVEDKPCIYEETDIPIEEGKV